MADEKTSTASSSSSLSSSSDDSSYIIDAKRYEIRDVWQKNLHQELNHISKLIESYPMIAMDTEFPGIVARPTGSFKSPNEYHYRTLKCNVDLLKIIQLGLTFSDKEGRLPEPCCTWQFNFRWNINKDLYAQDSISLLQKAGIDFKKHEEQGIDVQEFGELLMTSGIVLNDQASWISFHGGYDFGYLIKVLTCQQLPEDEAEFFELLKNYFPCVYDLKYLMKSCESLKGGLEQLSLDLKVKRVGPQHQAGSDSLLTSHDFFKMRSLFFENKIDDEKYLGAIYGLGVSLRK